MDHIAKKGPFFCFVFFGQAKKMKIERIHKLSQSVIMDRIEIADSRKPMKKKNELRKLKE
jgi:hypothetical protein